MHFYKKMPFIQNCSLQGRVVSTLVYSLGSSLESRMEQYKTTSIILYIRISKIAVQEDKGHFPIATTDLAIATNGIGTHFSC
jgi:hypothetical protein